MTAPRPTPRARRPAFTLIELLVVIGLLAIITAMGVLIIPNLNDQQRAPRGAGQVQQALQLAKYRAMRNRTAAGVRLALDSTGLFCTQLQYIEQPDDFIVQPGVSTQFGRISTGTALNIVMLETGPADFSGGFTNTQVWPVQVGDYLEVNGGLPHYISGVATKTQLTLASPLPATVSLASNYRIIRAPRVTADDPVQLPEDIAVDRANSGFDQSIGLPVNNPTANSVDILFAPSGEVLSAGASSAAIYLFVRDTSVGLMQGDPTLIVVYTRSGAVAAYPVNTTANADPYSFAKTGRSSGM